MAASGSKGSPSGSDGSVLELQAVCKSFDQTRAVDHVSFSIRAGEVFTLLGPSGCGKSTTLRLVAGLEQPDEGSIFLNGRPIVSAKERLFVPPERRNMGMVFQSYAIWPHFTVFENVAFPLSLRRWSRVRTRERVAEVLDVVGLTGLEDRPATMLSGGQQQRVALARALSYSPEILLLDEPLSNLDAKLREHMRVELRHIQRRLGISVLFVTHDQAEAMTMSDRVALMNEGRFEQVGSPSEVYERPATPFVRDFLGRALVLRGIARKGAGGPSLELVDAPGRSLRLLDGALDRFDERATVVIACRPEDAALEPSQAAAPNRLPVVVEEASYLGERMEYTVRTETGRPLLVFSPRRERFAVGTRLDLVVNPADANLWPE